MTPPVIFSRSAKRLKRSRMTRYDNGDRWLVAHMADDIRDRLEGVKRDFSNALIIGSDFGFLSAYLADRGTHARVADPSPDIARESGGVACDEDRFPFADDSFDLILSIGVLDTVDDLPGALVLIRRALKPGGLFLATCSGAGGLPFLRSLIGNASGVARFHPQIDARAAGDLLSRAGFQLPVAELETIPARYRSVARLLEDLRANGLTNVMNERHFLQRSVLENIKTAMPPVVEKFSVLTLTGWKDS